LSKFSFKFFFFNEKESKIKFVLFKLTFGVVFFFQSQIHHFISHLHYQQQEIRIQILQIT